MPQIFPRRTDKIVRLLLLLGPVLAVTLVLAAVSVRLSAWGSGVGVNVAQPAPFSHQHHVGGLGLDCRYCHDSVSESAFAGLPPTETCMTCHSQLWTDAPMLAPVRESLRRHEPLRWQRVHDLPDHVYFDHSAHVNAGVGCESCHGRVDQMPLTHQVHALRMGWCLDCHRDPAPRLRPPQAVFTMGWQGDGDRRALGEVLIAERGIAVERLTDCSVCHR